MRAGDALLLRPSSRPGRSGLGAVVRLTRYLPGDPVTVTDLLSQKKTLYWFLGLLEGMTHTGQFKPAEIYSLKSSGDQKCEIKVWAGLFRSGSLEKETLPGPSPASVASGNACRPLVCRCITRVSAPSSRDPLPCVCVSFPLSHKALSLDQGPALNLE